MNERQVQEILDILTEEAAEVIQCVSKIRRFGFNSCHPDRPNYTNLQHLVEEVGDVSCMIRLLIGTEIAPEEDFEKAAQNKLAKLLKYSTVFKVD